MAQLDKFLAHLASRGGSALRLEAGQQPRLDLATGESLAMLPNPLPSAVVDMVVNEVLPASASESLLRSGECAFGYDANGASFELQVRRTPDGLALAARPAGASSPAPPPRAMTAPETVRPSEPRPIELARPGGIEMARSSAPAPALPEGRASSAGPERHPLLARLLETLVREKASDLHLSSYELPTLRVNGDLTELDGFTLLGPKELEEMMRSMAHAEAWSQFQERNDADFAYAYEAGNCRLRVNFFRDRQGPGMVCRVIPNEIPDPDKLGLPDPIRRLSDLAKGLVLVTGPTGSGKSTTLAAILDLANQKRHDHILTIEDPIEFVHPRKGCLVNQREVGTHTESFKSGLRAALREDPDIVLVGEMRDLETISIALETAITGHLVFGTLHTNSAIGTIDRIVDQFPADRQQQIRVMLADCLKACISQILLKKKGGGRIAAIESLFITPAIANLMREGKNFQIPSAMQTGRAYGQKLMNDALVELIQAQKVDVEEAYLKCPDKESFMATLKRNNIAWDPRGEERPLPL